MSFERVARKSVREMDRLRGRCSLGNDITSRLWLAAAAHAYSRRDQRGQVY